MAGTPSSQPPESVRVLLALPPGEIAYFHSVLEGYDDLAVMRTISPEGGVVEVYVSPGAEEEFTDLMAALRDEGMPLRNVGGGWEPAPG